jgi:guanylate kinase
MGYIFCIMGKSATGKDTLFYSLKKKFEGQLMPIVTYTTRPKRTQETEGVEYHFITDEVLESFEEQGKIIERRTYDTIMGQWHYATIDDGQIDLNERSYLTIITLEAYTSFIQYFGKSNVVPLYIKVEEAERLRRAKDRERKQDNPQFEELNRRMKADRRDFSLQKLIEAGVRTSFSNRHFSQCLDHLSQTIIRYLGRVEHDNAHHRP